MINLDDVVGQAIDWMGLQRKSALRPIGWLAAGTMLGSGAAVLLYFKLKR